jgi:ubiquinone/menaquinone biosynthesis C-methylase UbiE
MISPASNLLDKIRQQFDAYPYPKIPLDKSPKDDINFLYIHNLVTPYYFRNQKVIETKGKVILDAGCGTGYKSLILAEANPGAKIVGIDISEESVKLARKRLEHHGFDNAEFHVLPIEELPELDYQFDYINCDELLYLFPDLTVALQSMKSVLKPDGIIRGNLHSSIQRFNFFRAQKVFTMMGLMDENPEDLEIEIVVETMKALKDNVQLKATT